MSSPANSLAPDSRALSAIIADGDAVARARLRRLLSAETDVRVVCECDDGRAASTAIARYRPDVVFLDVHLPELNGMDVFDGLPQNAAPHFVFLTAYDQYALDALGLDTVDYLLKPFDRDRVRQSLAGARRHVDASTDGHGRLNDVRRLLSTKNIAADAGASPYIDRIAVRHGGRLSFVRMHDVDYFESAANYVRIHVGPSVHQIREKISTLATRLDPERFARIHRSTIVNLHRIKEIRPAYSGDAILTLTGGQRVRLSRGYRDAIASAVAETA